MSNFAENMQNRQKNCYNQRREYNPTPAQLAVDTRRGRDVIDQVRIAPQVKTAIRDNFQSSTVAQLNPAQKAHFTRGTYNHLLGYYR